MDFKIAVLAGDGIGPEISVQGVDVMSAVCEKFGHKVSYEYALCGADAIDKVGDPFPEATYEVCKNADAVLFSAVGDPKFDNDPTAKVRPEQGLLAMRKKLGLFANIRPVQTFKCLLHKSPLRAELVEGADFLCIRELTGGMYFGEKYQDNDKAYDTNMYTRPEIERILKVGFEYAMKRRKHLTVVDKANVLASSRLWRQIAQEMAPSYPEVTTDYMFVDNAAMRMIQEPTFFDVMVTENTFGDILTDEGSCISGSMGLLPSASTGESTPVFEPIHGSWPQAKGLNIANPLAQILSVAMLFEYFDLKEEGALIRKAVDASLDAYVRTPEIQVEGKPKYGTKEVGAWIVDYIKKHDTFLLLNLSDNNKNTVAACLAATVFCYGGIMTSSAVTEEYAGRLLSMPVKSEFLCTDMAVRFSSRLVIIVLMILFSLPESCSRSKFGIHHISFSRSSAMTASASCFCFSFR